MIISPNITTFNLINEIKLEALWSGSLYSSFKPIEDEYKSYIEPFIGLSLFPYINLEGKNVFKLFVGYEIKSNINIEKNDLFNKRNDWKLSFGYNINGKIKKGCFKIDSDSKYFENLNFNENAIVSRNNSVNFETSCLKTGEWNEIKIWWTPTKNKTNFKDESGSLTINFFLPKTINIKHNLDKEKKFNFKIPYFFLIKTKWNEKPIIKEIFYKENLFNTKLKKIIIDAIPLTSLWEFKSLNFSINLNNLKELLNLFKIDLIWREIRKFKNNSKLDLDPLIEIELIKNLKSLKLENSSYKKINDEIKEYHLNTEIKTYKIPFLLSQYKQKFNIFFFEEDIYSINLKYIFISKINFKSIFNTNIYLVQKIMFKNDSINKKIEIEKIEIKKNILNKLKENFIFIPFTFLYELSNIENNKIDKFFDENKLLKYAN